VEGLIVVIILLVLVLIVYGWWAAEQRKKRLIAWAASKGLRYDAGKVRGLDDRFPEFDCLRQGSDRYADNVMQGAWGERRILAFDYHYKTTSTDSKGRTQTSHHSFSAVIAHSDLPLRPLLIRPEGFFDKVGEFFGYDDIDFESAEFSRRFYVKSPDRKWAYDVLHQRTMEFLLQAPTFTLRFAPGAVIAYDSSDFSVSKFEAAAEVIRGVLDRLPEYVVRQQRGAGGRDPTVETST